MKYKNIFSLIIGTLITLPVCSADNDIDLHKKGDSQTGSRSITTECVYAYIDNGTLLNITFNLSGNPKIACASLLSNFNNASDTSINRLDKTGCFK